MTTPVIDDGVSTICVRVVRSGLVMTVAVSVGTLNVDDGVTEQRHGVNEKEHQKKKPAQAGWGPQPQVWGR